MTTDLDQQDRVPVPHFTASLWQELAELHERHQSSSDWRGGRRSLVAGAAFLATAAAIAVGVIVIRPDNEAGRVAVPELAARIIAATGDATDSTIVHANRDYAESGSLGLINVDSEQWVDWHGVPGSYEASLPPGGAPGGYRAIQRNDDGTVIYESGGAILPVPVDGRPSQRNISHLDRTYNEGCWPMSGLPYGGDAEWIRQLLSEGRYVEDGTETVDGSELVRILIRNSDSGDPSTRSVLLDDPETYLPVVDRHFDDDGK
ncbi:MAG: hypothetical protein ACRD08_22770, partial [Acidimicrobiales bacterium]